MSNCKTFPRDFELLERGDLHLLTEKVIVYSKTLLLLLQNYPAVWSKVDAFILGHHDPALPPGAAPGKYLHNLRLLQVYAVNCLDSWMLEVLDTNPALSELQLILRHNWISPTWFDEAAKRCGNLQKLELYSLRTEIDDGVLRRVAEHCLQLRELKIDYNRQKKKIVPEEPVVAIARRCTLLERIKLVALTVTPGTVSALCLHCRHLTSLSMPGIPLSYQDMMHLQPPQRKQAMTALECRWTLLQESEVHACAALLSGPKTLKVTVPGQCKRAFAAAAVYLKNVHELRITLVCSRLPGTILSAVTASCRALRLFAAHEMPVEKSDLISIIKRNPYIREVSWDGYMLRGTKDIALYASGQSCAGVPLEVYSAMPTATYARTPI